MLRKKSLYTIFSFLLLCTLTSCKNYSLNDFLNAIAPGYVPFETAYTEEQIRCGFTRIGSGDFSFDDKIVGFVDKKILSKTTSFEINKKQISSIGAKLQGIVGVSLSLNNVSKIDVSADGINTYFFPTQYNLYLFNESQIELYKKKELLKEIVEIDKLKFKVKYKEGYNIKADLDKLSAISDLGASYTQESNNELSIAYEKRIVGYRTEAISSEKVHLDKGNVVIFGKVSLKNNESNSVKLTYTDGSFSLDTKIDMYNRYAIKVIPNALDSITVVDKTGKELGKRKFNPLNSIFEYNLP